MNILRRNPYVPRACALSVLLSVLSAVEAAADPPGGPENVAAANDAPALAPQENFFASVKQAFKEDFDREVVRGHFDVGSPPDSRRYYCLVDAKTGKSQPNAVAGETLSRKDGMTGIKGSAVSVFTCASAEQQGMLVTAGYVLHGAASRAAVPVAPAPAQRGSAHLESPTAKEMPPPPITAGSPGRVDVAGVKLGMSVDEVRAVLRSKKLGEYHEWTEALGHGESPKAAAPPTSGRFVNSIAAWTTPPTLGDGAAGEGESFEVMFTPVPGKERVMAVVHSVSYAPIAAVRQSALDDALVKKYGGYTGGDLPASPTWRVQSGGDVQVGDPCNRRGAVDVGGPKMGAGASRPNLALKTTLDEFQFQIDHCGVAIVSEDHSVVPGAASRGDRLISRFTVTAYSPSIGFQGASMAAQWLQSAAEESAKATGARMPEPVPSL